MDTIPKLVKGLVLAGGEGKRLRPLTYYFQKCMIPIGHSQKPLLEYILRLLKYNGITDISLLVGYKHEQIVNYFNNGSRFGIDIDYIFDSDRLKGTGGSLLNAYQNGVLDSYEDILIYYGDIVSNIKLTEMLKQHTQKRAMATLAISEGFQTSVGVANVKSEKVISWIEKPKLNIKVGIGIILLNKSAMKELERLSEFFEDFDIMKHLIPHLIEKKKAVNAYITKAFWYDIGTTEKYEKLENGIIEDQFKYILDPEVEARSNFPIIIN